MVTVAPATKLAPLTVTAVPPAVGPDDGLTAPTVGAGETGDVAVMLVRCSAGGALPRSMMTFALYVPGAAYVVLAVWVAPFTLSNFAPNVAFVGSPHATVTVLTLVPASEQFHQKV
jgi:hypothetical protein